MAEYPSNHLQHQYVRDCAPKQSDRCIHSDMGCFSFHINQKVILRAVIRKPLFHHSESLFRSVYLSEPEASDYEYAASEVHQPATHPVYLSSNNGNPRQHQPNPTDRRHSSHNCVPAIPNYLSGNSRAGHIIDVNQLSLRFHRQKDVDCSARFPYLLSIPAPKSSSEVLRPSAQHLLPQGRFRQPVSHLFFQLHHPESVHAPLTNQGRKSPDTKFFHPGYLL